MAITESSSNDPSGPLVTVAIPTYNRASWLGECVRSSLSQTYPRIEVLISDNASTDETHDVLKQLNDARLRIIRQKTNIGLLSNWNFCLAEARGEYIVFVSDDDRIAPQFVERCVDLIGKEPQIPAILALSDTYSTSAGRIWSPKGSQRVSTGIRDGAEVMAEYLNDQLSINMCSIMLRTRALRALGGFRLDLPHAADVAAWAGLVLSGKVGLLNEVCATYYTHSNCETAVLGVDQCVRDGWQVAEVISSLALEHIADPYQRREMATKARQCFARRGLLMLLSLRRTSGSLPEVLGLVWRHRREFGHIDARHLWELRRRIAIALCPRRLVDWARQASDRFSGAQARIKRSQMSWLAGPRRDFER
jgi:glycosyltransferase involved in cell wall biosynthesis